MTTAVGLENRTTALNPAVEGGGHPFQRRMFDVPLDVGEHLPSVDLIPASIKPLSGHAK